MKLPKYIDLLDQPDKKSKHSGEINYQRINDLLSEFDAVEIGEILAAGFIYEIYGIELDLEDQETKETFPHLQDRACRTQYRQLLTDFDVNYKAYTKRSENGKRAANVRWHGQGGKIETEPEAETEQPAAETEPKKNIQPEIAHRRKPDMTDEEREAYIKKMRKVHATFDSFRQAVLTELEQEKITTKDHFYILEYGKERY